MRTAKRTQKQHYVDNQEFLAAIVKYKQKVFAVAEKEIEGFSDLDSEEQFTILKDWKKP